MKRGKRPSGLVVAVGAMVVLGAISFGVALQAALAPRADAPAPAAGMGAAGPAKVLAASESAVSRVIRGRRPAPPPPSRIGIPLADPVPARLPADGVPRGWELKEFAGKAQVELVRAEPGLAFRLRSDQTSFALFRQLVVDLPQTPVLSWAWKVTRLPAGGDVRGRDTDDEAIQVYVVFPRWPALSARSDVIGYVWDTRAPVGTVLTSPKAPNVKVIVVESGAGRVGDWQRQTRNVLDDYKRLFGRRPPRVGAVAVMTDADDTRGVAEALVSDLAFSRAPS